VLKHALYLAVLVSILVSGCGVKAPPIPPDVRVPKTISNLQAGVRAGNVHLRWSMPRENMDGSRPVDLASFTVLRREETRGCVECPGEFAERAKLDLRSIDGYQRKDNIIEWRDNGLREGSMYLYKVVGVNHWGYPSAPSNQVIIEWCEPPSTPSSVTGEGQDVSVLLSWKGVEGAQGYNVYRRQKAASFPLNPINRKPVREERHLDPGLKNGQEYFYIVRTVTICGKTAVEGPSSHEVAATPIDRTPPRPPVGLTAVPQKEGIELDWFPNAEPDLLGYHLYRWEPSETAPRRINAQTIQETTFLDRGTEPGKQYHYAVTAVDGSPLHNESRLSSSVTATYRGIQ